MDDVITRIIGYTAAVAGTSIMLPQVIRSFRTKKTSDVSMGMIIVFIINCSLWFTYGLLISKPPLLISNSISGLLNVVQLIMKFKYDGEKSNQRKEKEV